MKFHEITRGIAPLLTARAGEVGSRPPLPASPGNHGRLS
jgi:hypothetical protein